jgi:hypothetical protein
VPPPERKRAVIIGAGPTGMSVAFHLGEHSLLLERQNSLERIHDYSHDFEMGAADGGAVGGEDRGADGDGFAEVTSVENPSIQNKALFISCSSRAQADTGEHTLIHVERWRPPDLATPRPRGALFPPPSVRTLMPLLRGELRLGATVTRIVPAAHLLELADGHRYVYDKLVSTLTLAGTEQLATHDLPEYVHRDESLRYWLSEHDIEVVDRTMQDYFGDLDEFAAGKRVAEQTGQALAEKFGKARHLRVRGTRLFEPRLVRSLGAPSMP